MVHQAQQLRGSKIESGEVDLMVCATQHQDDQDTIHDVQVCECECRSKGSRCPWTECVASDIPDSMVITMAVQRAIDGMKSQTRRAASIRGVHRHRETVIMAYVDGPFRRG